MGSSEGNRRIEPLERTRVTQEESPLNHRASARACRGLELQSSNTKDLRLPRMRIHENTQA
ncbi:hypothetical protein Ancab_011153 [Ancistrocladus abbreviatus]